MTLRQIYRRDLAAYCDGLSKHLADGRHRAKIEIESKGVGTQAIVNARPLLGVSYDPKSDTIEIALEGFWHRVHEPRGLYADERTEGVATVEIVAHDGVRRIVRLDPPIPRTSKTGPRPAR
jgi:Family of unknown function (DUF5335)